MYLLLIALFSIGLAKVSAATTIEDLASYLDYLAAKDMVISKNIANVNTPNYLPIKVNENAESSNEISLITTEDGHIGSESKVEIGLSIDNIHELKPNGNGVSLEHEMAKKNENSMILKEMANIFHKTKAMIQTSISGNYKP